MVGTPGLQFLVLSVGVRAMLASSNKWGRVPSSSVPGGLGEEFGDFFMVFQVEFGGTAPGPQLLFVGSDLITPWSGHLLERRRMVPSSWGVFLGSEATPCTAGTSRQPCGRGLSSAPGSWGGAAARVLSVGLDPRSLRLMCGASPGSWRLEVLSRVQSGSITRLQPEPTSAGVDASRMPCSASALASLGQLKITREGE